MLPNFRQLLLRFPAWQLRCTMANLLSSHSPNEDSFHLSPSEAANAYPGKYSLKGQFHLSLFNPSNADFFGEPGIYINLCIVMFQGVIFELIIPSFIRAQFRIFWSVKSELRPSFMGLQYFILIHQSYWCPSYGILVMNRIFNTLATYILKKTFQLRF